MKVVDQETGEDLTEKLKAERDADQDRVRGGDQEPRRERGERRNAGE